MATYPTSPPPNRFEDASLDLPAITVEFNKITRQARERHKAILRRVRLVYEHRTFAEFDVIRAFFDQHKGRSIRFDFTDPDTGEAYKAKFDEPRLRWKITQGHGPQYTFVTVIKEAR